MAETLWDFIKEIRKDEEMDSDIPRKKELAKDVNERLKKLETMEPMSSYVEMVAVKLQHNNFIAVAWYLSGIYHHPRYGDKTKGMANELQGAIEEFLAKGEEKGD